VVVVILSELRAVRRGLKELPFEIHQENLIANSYMQTCVITEEHCTRYQDSTPFVLNGQPYTVFLVFCNAP
jgi:hypothetical protein